MTLTVPPPGQILRWLGGPIDVRVEIDTGLAADNPQARWDVDRWGADDPAWTDVSPYVFEVGIRAGIERWGERFVSSSAAITLDDTTGLFTPDSGQGDWLLPFRPGRRIRVVAIPDEETGKVPLFTGQIDSTEDLYDDAGHAITTQVVCTDFMAVLAAYNPAMLETPTGTQSTDARVNAALDRIDYPPASRIVQPGQHSMQSSYLAQTVLEECQRAADAEGGSFYADRQGFAVLKARDWLVTDPRSVNVQGYLGYDTLPVPPGSTLWDVGRWDVDVWEGFELNTAHIVGLETSWEAARVVNDVAFARVGSTLQRAEDLDSQALHGIRSHHRTDLENSLNSEVAILATRYLAAFKDSRMRVDAVTISAVESYPGDDRQHLFWDTRFGDRLAIRVQPPWGWSFDKEVHVMGLAHQITGSDWLLTLQLDDAQTYEGGI